MSFIEELDQRFAPLWKIITEHPFLQETRDGTIAAETFATWLRQDYLFVEAAIPFVAALIPRAPVEQWGFLSGVVSALEKELKLFEERAHSVDVDLRGAPPAFACHAYVQFLLATAHTRSYPEAFTVLYAAERAYHESWLVVRDGIDPDSPWMPFVENWAGEEFAGYVSFLGRTLEELAADCGRDTRRRMAELYRLTLLYEIAFWQMAHGAEEWPGVESDLADAVGDSPRGPTWNPDPDSTPDRAWSHIQPSPSDDPPSPRNQES